MNSILSIYQSNKHAFDGKGIFQILAFTGDGKLKDNNKTSTDFREFLSEIPSLLIKEFADNCLSESFSDGGFVLQDIINQIGARLSYSVTNGLYRGKSNDIGFDGIWKSKDDHSLIVEVKTTDAYRINLDTLANYRNKLILEEKVHKEKSSILIICGRQDTGDLEAQIRGSRHAWDIRLLSTDSLIKLLELKESLNDSKTIQQITELLKPKEFTRIDQLIDLIFTTTQDSQLDVPNEVEVDEADNSAKKVRNFSADREAPVNFNEVCFEKAKKQLKINLIKQTKTSYSNLDKSTALICSVSKKYTLGKNVRYWYAFHPHQQEFLHEFNEKYVALGCGSPNNTLLIPFRDFEPLLKNCGITERAGKMYWHVVIHYRDAKYLIGQPGLGRGEMIDLTRFKI